MLEKIKRAVNDYNMLSVGDNVIVALSGGADSVSLVSALKILSKELSINVFACHVNHNLRGSESDADEAYVKSLCEKLEVPLTVFSVDVKANQQKHESTEECARKLRYTVFQGLAIEKNAKIATAHNANDNAETVFLNIVRGTGLKGVCGIPPVRDYLIRPLIYCTRMEVENFCAENSLSFCTDKTNFSTDYTRNKIRIDVLPKLLEINPSLLDGIGRMTQNLGEDSAFLEKLANQAKSDALVSENKYDITKLKILEKCVLRRLISLVLWDNGIEPSSLKITGIEEIILLGKGKVNIEKNKFAIVRKGVFEISTILQNYRKKIV